MIALVGNSTLYIYPLLRSAIYSGRLYIILAANSSIGNLASAVWKAERSIIILFRTEGLFNFYLMG